MRMGRTGIVNFGFFEVLRRKPHSAALSPGESGKENSLPGNPGDFRTWLGVGSVGLRQRWLLAVSVGVLDGVAIAVLGFSVLSKAVSVSLLALAVTVLSVVATVIGTGARVREQAVQAPPEPEVERVQAPRLTGVVVEDNVRPPLVRELKDSMVLGVHPASIGGNDLPPYVARDVAAELNDALRRGSFVLLIGESLSGKSRLAYEAMRSQLPNHVFVMAGSRAGLKKVDEVVEEIDEDDERCVIWLNDLDRFLGPYGLTPAQVARWRTKGDRSVVLLATMRSGKYQEYWARASRDRVPGQSAQAGHELHRGGLAILEMAQVINVPREWSPDEQARARELDDPRIAEALRNADRFGPAAHLVAAPQLYEDWKAAWAPGAHPRGAAMVAAAVDARRCGWLRPVRLELLKLLHHAYLERRGGDALLPESWRDALEWATTPHQGTDTLLMCFGEGRLLDGEYFAFDYLLETAEAEHAEIPDETWRVLIDAAEPTMAWDIGQSAYRRREYRWAEHAFAKAAESGDHTALLAQARAIGSDGRAEVAVALLRDDIDRSTRQLGENSPDVPRTRYELQLWRTRELERDLGPDAPETLASRHVLAVRTAQAGHVREAVAELRSVVADRIRILGADHPDTLVSRHEFAELTGYAGHFQAAVDLFDEVIADRERTLGRYALETLRSRARRAWWIGRGGHSKGAVELLTGVCDELITRHGGDDTMTLATRHELAYWTGHAGDPRLAEMRFAEVVADRTRVLGPDHPDTLASRSNHARWVGEAGRPAEAVRLFDLVIEDRTRVLGPDHPDTLWSRHRRVYWAAEVGADSEVVRVLSAVLADRERILGHDHPDTLDSKHQLARWVANTGDPSTGVRMLREVLEERTRMLGAEHPETLSTRHRLAVCMAMAGDRGEALEMLRAVARERRRVMGALHPETLSTLNNIAYWTAMDGDARAALELFRSVAEDRARELGEAHFSTLETKHEIAYWTKSSGDWHTAVDLFEEVVRERRGALGADHARTLESRHAMAQCIAESGDWRSAVELFAQVVADRRRTLGQHHPDTLTSLHEQAYWHYRLGNLEIAARMFDAVVTGRERAHGQDHPWTLDSRYNLVRIIRPKDDAALAHLLGQIFKEQTRTLRLEHPEVLRTRRRLAQLLTEPGEAREKLAEVAEEYRRSLGPKHPETLTTLSYLSVRMWRAGDRQAAVGLLADVVARRTEVLGADHPITRESRKRLWHHRAVALRGACEGKACRVHVEFVDGPAPLNGRDRRIAVTVIPQLEHPWSSDGHNRPPLEVIATPLSDAEVQPALDVCEANESAEFAFVARVPGSHRVRFTVYARPTGTALQEVESTFEVAEAPLPDRAA